MAFPPTTKNPGDLIKSQDWNETIGEIKRLEQDKVNKSGDKMAGSLTIDGNVGIGTSSPPAEKLHVVGNQLVQGPDPFKEYGQEARLCLGDTAHYIKAKHGTGLQIGTWQASDAITLKQKTGYVGIGTIDPMQKLSISGSESEPHGLDASIGLRNVAAEDEAEWYLRAGATGTITPEGGFSIADKNAYRVVIDKKGDIGIGTTSPEAPLHVASYMAVGPFSATGGPGGIDVTGVFAELGIVDRSLTSWPDIPIAGNRFVWYNKDKVARLWTNESLDLMTIDENGNFTVKGKWASKPGGGPWTGPSDKRLKKYIKPLKGSLGNLLQLRGVSFEWKEPENQGGLVGKQMGMVAQEVEKVFPEWVDMDPDGFKALTIRGFEALVVEALRELNTEIEKLQAKNADLEKRIVALEK